MLSRCVSAFVMNESISSSLLWGTHRCVLQPIPHYTVFFSVSMCLPCLVVVAIVQNVNNTDLMNAFNLFIIYLFLMRKPALCSSLAAHINYGHESWLLYFIIRNMFGKDFSTPIWDEIECQHIVFVRFSSGQNLYIFIVNWFIQWISSRKSSDRVRWVSAAASTTHSNESSMKFIGRNSW